MSDPQPFKLRTLYALTDTIKSISTADGYAHDLADFVAEDGVTTERVVRGRAWFGETDPIPMISVLEGTDPGDLVGEPPLETATGEYDWRLILQGFVRDDPVHPTDPAYRLLADVRKRLAAEVKRKTLDHDPDPFGMGTGKNRIVKLTVGSGVVRPADDVSAYAWFWLSLTLRVVERPDLPFE